MSTQILQFIPLSSSEVVLNAFLTKWMLTTIAAHEISTVSTPTAKFLLAITSQSDFARCIKLGTILEIEIPFSKSCFLIERIHSTNNFNLHVNVHVLRNMPCKWELPEVDEAWAIRKQMVKIAGGMKCTEHDRMCWLFQHLQSRFNSIRVEWNTKPMKQIIGRARNEEKEKSWRISGRKIREKKGE